MKRTIQITKDGSSTIALDNTHVTYHSTSGAVGESLHVFIEAGLNFVHQSQKLGLIKVFEMGFGTGLNALLSWQYAQANNITIDYTSIELYPLNHEETKLLNYGTQLQLENAFEQLHSCEWQQKKVLDTNFVLDKQQCSLLDFEAKSTFNVIFFDAFAPSEQPELWTTEVFTKLYAMLENNGVLVTYCSKGDVRRSLLTAGFTVEKIKGYAYKREMLRAKKA